MKESWYGGGDTGWARYEITSGFNTIAHADKGDKCAWGCNHFQLEMQLLVPTNAEFSYFFEMELRLAGRAAH